MYKPNRQTSLSQIEHLLQTAEAIRRDGKPEWMQVSNSILFPDLMSRLTYTDQIKVTGLVHDLGKLLLLFGSEGQWDVVGVSHLLTSRLPLSDRVVMIPGHFR
jgi:inositol oxygenase